jgi:hypothetical protein
MVNVIVGKKRNVKISANGTGGIINTTVPVTLKNTPVLSSQGAVPRLDHLPDVNASQETDGATLVYSANNDTYYVKKLDLSEVTGGLDGGEF